MRRPVAIATICWLAAAGCGPTGASSEKSAKGAATEAPEAVPTAAATTVPTADAGSAALVEARARVAALCNDDDAVAADVKEKIAACHAGNGAWNFGTGACLTVATPSYACTFAGVRGVLAELGLSPTAKLTEAETDGAALVSCGRSADGSHVFLQWVSKAKSAAPVCASGDGAAIVTACYASFGASGAPQPPADAESQKAAVFDCLE
jgi:hypothetical protein